MRVAVTGAGGLLGRTLVPLWRAAGLEVAAFSRAALDVTDPAAVDRALEASAPEVVVHLAAWTDVDGAEAAPARAMAVNGEGARHVAEACARHKAVIAYLSTDYVFAGTSREPVAPEAPPAPAGAYARSKAAGEAAVQGSGAAHLVLRTAWLYGPEGRNFVDTMREAAAARRAVRVVDDQVGTPTPTRLVAEALYGLLVRGARGVWHAVAGGATSRCEEARCVYRAAGADPALVLPCTSDEAARAAPRPACVVLDARATVAALGVEPPAWDEAVAAYVRTGRLLGLGLIRTAA
jgi:dTDP-4-dehydrorhamnose reductase